MPKLKVEQDEQTGLWNVLMLCRDGIYDVLSEHPTRSEALAAKRHEIASSAADASAERRYQAQYDYACGYRD